MDLLSKVLLLALMSLIYALHIVDNDLEAQRLRAVYKQLYDTVSWPEPIPPPEEVTLQWNDRMTDVSARCWWDRKRIEVSSIYKDKRLREQLKDVMAHEAAHFVWHSHSKQFEQFMKSIGADEGSLNERTRESEIYWTVRKEYDPTPHISSCPGLRLLWRFFNWAGKTLYDLILSLFE